MIALFDRRRRRLLSGLLAVAVTQLAATMFVAQALHEPARGALPLAAAAALIGFGCEALSRRLSEGLGLDYVTAVRQALFRHLMQAEPEQVQRRRHGAMLQSFVGDLTALRQWVAEGIMRALLAVVALCGLMGWLALAMPGLAAVTLGVVALACLAGAALLRPLSRAVRAVRKERGSVSAFASERLGASATVLACGRAGSEARRLARRVERLNRAALKRAWLTGFLRALPHLATTAIVLSAAFMARGMHTPGMAGLVLVIGIIGLALRDLARAAELAVPGRVSHRRISRLLALRAMEYGKARPRKRGEAGMLVIDGLQLRPGDGPMAAEARREDVVMLSGDPQVCGGLLRMLAGLCAPDSGAVRWNGADLRAMRPSRRRRIVGLASGDLPLLPGSNGLNLRYRNPGMAPEDLEALAGTWRIDLRGAHGDPVRLQLLRAMAGTPPLLLLAPDDRELGEEDAHRLAEAIGQWPGVVLLASRHPLLCRRATRHWNLSQAGLGEIGCANPPLAPVNKDLAA